MRQPARLKRAPHLRSPFEPGNPLSGYYNDLTLEVRAANPLDGASVSRSLPTLVNFTSVAQLGLGAWQLAKDDELAEGDHPPLLCGWPPLDDRGRLLPVGDASHLRASSTVDFGHDTGRGCELVLASCARGRLAQELFSAAARAVMPLPDRLGSLQTSSCQFFRISDNPPSHVLNDASRPLGLYDLSAIGQADVIPADLAGGPLRHSKTGCPHCRAASAIRHGRLVTLRSLFPSDRARRQPFYHRLHIELLRATNELAPNHRFQQTARWERSATDPLPRPRFAGRRRLMIRPRGRLAWGRLP